MKNDVKIYDSFNREIYLVNSYEIKLASYFIKNKIKWTTEIINTFTFKRKGKTKTYYPNFYLPDHNKYVHVKTNKSNDVLANERREYYQDALIELSQYHVDVIDKLGIKGIK